MHATCATTREQYWYSSYITQPMEQDIHILTSEAVGLLKEMIAIPSPSFGEDEVCSHICRWLSDRGLTFERIGSNIILESWRQEDASTVRPHSVIMLCAHIDTVTAGTDYSFDPYEPDYGKAAEVIGSRLGKPLTAEEIVAGLGSNDDGASVVSMIAAFRHFCSRKYDKTGMILVLSCEEERSGINGMTGLWGTRICSRNEMKDGCTPVDFAIVGEPTGMKAATAERGLLVIDATAHGISGHAARNEGKNALYIAMEDIMKLRSYEFDRISPRMGKVNLNVTQINAGTAHNVIPDRCDFVIDIRPTERYSNEEILKELQQVCASELKPRNLANRSSATYEHSPLQETAEALGIETFSSPTTSDWMRIDCDAIKMGPGDSARSHRKDEFVLVKEIEDGIRTYIDFIERL